MDYRRRALLRSKQTAPTSPPANRLDRVVAISSIVSNIVIGLGTLALAGIGIHLTNEFNQWQKADSNQTQQQVAFAVCISAAQLVFDAIKFRPEKDAANIIQTAVTGRSDCARYGVNIPDLVATMILEDRRNIDPKIVQRAAKRVAAVPKKQVSKFKTVLVAAQYEIGDIKKIQEKLKLYEHSYDRSVSFNGFPVVSATEEIYSNGVAKVDIESSDECAKKLDTEAMTKPNDLSWSVKCDNGNIITRNAF